MEVELYGVLTNSTEELLQLNEFLNETGFEFVKIPLEDLSTKFSTVFGLDIPEPNEKIKVNNLEVNRVLADKVFANSDYKSWFDYSIYNEKPFVVWLKNKQDIYLKNNVINKYYDSNGILIKKDLQNAHYDILKKLRLSGSGKIGMPLFFCFNPVRKRTIFTLSSNQQDPLSHQAFFVVNEQTLHSYSALSKVDFDNVQEYIKISIETFNESYKIFTRTVRFILLITSLEALFNLGKDQIRQTISRHTALVVSKSQREFEEKYKMLKRFYDERSRIVHGGKHAAKFNIEEELNLLEDIVRTAIVEVTKINCTKEELFNKLNAKGY